MKKLGLILLAIFLVVCSTSNNTTETIETTETAEIYDHNCLGQNG